ncbi:saccharopine dehydrogenase family protein [Rhodohalobacter sp. 8-1]|uniref:saccharopine dehydrogenase family protein n=1 Tax=Rhodohalobacter sp. 8-1 TaxID=3131972 RepID=UPI0030EC03AC
MPVNKSANKWIIYGSYGYTGQLIAEKAAGLHEEVILSGRNREKLIQQSEELGLPYRAADLSNTEQMNSILTDAHLVIHCAGPFVYTWKPMLDACIRNSCHYLDITGEIGVFERIKARDKEITDAGIMAMPGTGFDVVPTDCLALYLNKELPDATNLELAFMGLGGGVSHGTAQTMAENLGFGGAIRQDGKIKSVPAAWKTREIDFGEKRRMAVTIPWGDVSTAHFTTGIENIVVYTAMKKSAIRWLKRSNWIAPVLKLSVVRHFVKKLISKKVTGPDQTEREEGKSYIWGEVTNSSGETVTARQVTLEGYRLTALSALHIAQKVSEENFKTGYQTPASAYGEDLILEIVGTDRELV